jgi:hypothetical protein
MITNSNLVIEDGNIVVYTEDTITGKTRHIVPYISDVNKLLDPLNTCVSDITKLTPIVKIIESDKELDNPPEGSIYILYKGESFTFYCKQDIWKQYELVAKENIKTIEKADYILPNEIIEHISNSDIHTCTSNKKLLEQKLDDNKTINGKALKYSPIIYGTDNKISENSEYTLDKILKQKANINAFYTKEDIDSYFVRKPLTVKKTIIKELEGVIQVDENEIDTTILIENVKDIKTVVGSISDSTGTFLINTYSPDFWSLIKIENNNLILKSMSINPRIKKTGKYSIEIEYIKNDEA